MRKKFICIILFYSISSNCQTNLQQSGFQSKNTLFTPFALGKSLKFWLDMSDFSRVFNDKDSKNLALDTNTATSLISKNGIKLQADFFSASPTLSTVPSGSVSNSGASFSATDKSLKFTTTSSQFYPNGRVSDNGNFRFYNFSDKRTIVAIVKTDGTSNGTLFGSNNSANSFLNNHDIVEVINGVIRNNFCASCTALNSPVTQIISSGSVVSGFSMISLEVSPGVSGVNNTSGRSLYINGSLIGTATNTGTYASSFSLFSIGGYVKCCTATANPRDGKLVNAEIGEIIIYNDVNSVNRQKIEGYLAWKRGLQALLPLAHPYRNFSPTL